MGGVVSGRNCRWAELAFGAVIYGLSDLSPASISILDLMWPIWVVCGSHVHVGYRIMGLKWALNGLAGRVGGVSGGRSGRWLDGRFVIWSDFHGCKRVSSNGKYYSFDWHRKALHKCPAQSNYIASSEFDDRMSVGANLQSD